MLNNKITHKQLNEISRYIEYRDLLNTDISKASIGWHLDHILKVYNGVCQTIIKSNPENYKRSLNLFRVFCFAFSYFPRGKAKAPKVVLPPDVITLEDLEVQLLQVTDFKPEINSLHKNVYFKHHIFGQLNRRYTQIFLRIHTEHHLKIIREILRT